MADAHREPPTTPRRPGLFVVSDSAVGIVAVDDHGVIRSCNRAAEELLGRPAQVLVGQPLGFPTVVDETRRIDLMMPDGSARTVEMRVSTTTWDGRRLYITAFHEPVHTVDTDEELTRVLDALQSDLERQSLAVAVTTHELDNSLFAIGLTVEQFRRGTAATDTQRAELIDSIDERARHMQALVGRLRTATRLDPEEPPVAAEPVPVFEFVLERLQGLHGWAEDVRLFCERGLVVLANRGELGQMLDNYLQNALTHGRPPIDIEVTERDGWVRIRVCDHGPGVPEQFRPHLFERFSRAAGAERHTEGTGLGLWITRGLARSSGGDAWFEPNQPRGACFCLRLPRKQPRQP